MKCIDETDETVTNKSRGTLINTGKEKLDNIDQNMEADDAISTIKHKELLTIIEGRNPDVAGRELDQAAEMKEKYLQQSCTVLDEEIKSMGAQLKISDMTTASPIHQLSAA